MPKFKVGDVVKVHYNVCAKAETYVVHAVLSAGSFSPELDSEVSSDAYIWREENGTFSWDEQKDIDNECGLTCFLVSSNDKEKVLSSMYPHTCEYCGFPCWNGINFVCSNPNCITKE